MENLAVSLPAYAIDCQKITTAGVRLGRPIIVAIAPAMYHHHKEFSLGGYQ